MRTEILNVLYQFNENYVPCAGTSIVSLLENNKDISKICFYIVIDNVTRESQERIIEQINQYGRDSVLIDSTDLVQKMKSIGLNEYRGSYATNMKLFVRDFIPENVGRLLYIDSDTIIVGSLKQLLDYDMQGKPIAMCQDSLCKGHKACLGFSKDTPYYNGGIILFDMIQWRRMNCTEQICNHLETERNHYLAPDQDVINVVFKDKIYQLPIEYNLQPIHLVYGYKQYYRLFGQSSYYGEEEVCRAVKYPIILHTFRYLGEFPWHKDSLHPCTSYFDKYLEISLWNTYIKEPSEKNDIVFRVERWLYRILPKSVFIVIFKMCFEFFMWKSNQDSVKQKNNIRM